MASFVSSSSSSTTSSSSSAITTIPPKPFPLVRSDTPPKPGLLDSYSGKQKAVIGVIAVASASGISGDLGAIKAQ